LKKLDLGGAQVTRISATGAEKLGTWINAISPILLIIGVVGFYIEFKTPGFGLPGITGICAFVLYFFGGYIAALSGAEWILVFIVGVALLASELFVHPGTILPGLFGATLIVVSLVMGMVDVYPGGPLVPTLPQFRLPLQQLVLALAIATIIILLLMRYFPKTPLYNVLISQSASGVQSDLQRREKQISRKGQVGVAISALRPGGKAQFGDEIVDVITQGDMISKGEKVRVIGSSGTEAIVETIS
jgi:membrane-bound serine protease (ClpP class)